jgi:Phosphotransferase enzyme family
MEERLAGGLTGVVRIGDTVRRAAGPWTESVQALLRHVRARGVDWIPEPRGRDEQGREVVSFLPGEVPRYPLPGYVWNEAVLLDVGRRLRALHDATAGFGLAGRAWRLPAHAPAEVVCHNDFGPHNLVFRDGAVVGAIDFDTASPGPRAWDLAHLAYRLVPLTHPASPEAPPAGVRPARERLAALCAAYGEEIDPRALVAVAVRRLDELAAFTRSRADAGSPALRAHVALYERDAAHLRGQGGTIA